MGREMLMGWKKYCENDHPIKSNLQIQCDPNINFHAILSQTQKNTIQKFAWQPKNPRMAKVKQRLAWEVSQYLIKLHYRAIVIKTSWYWHKNPEINALELRTQI